jgi:hypothetical protein
VARIESVLPSLAFLAADYHAQGKPADVFFKRCARFLQETTTVELALLRTVKSESALISCCAGCATSTS